MKGRLKVFALAFLLTSAPGLALASSGTAAPFSFKSDMGNEASLQRGAGAYVTYCISCHSLKYMRYNRLGEDLGIPQDLVMKHLAPATAKPGDTIISPLPPAAAAAFGRAPPDLTLVARARGIDWVYSYLLTFYADPSRPTGVNNLMLPGLAMPHVLAELQGTQKLVEHKEGEGEHGGHKGPQFELQTPGKLTPKEYQQFVGDLTNFLVYTAEPARMQRFGLGAKVILFLLLFTGMAYLLKREYWKDVH